MERSPKETFCGIVSFQSGLNYPLKVLVIRLSSMGDVVLITPVIRILNRQKHAEISVLTKEEYAPIFKDNAYVTKIYAWRKDCTDTILSDLKSKKFNFIIDLQGSLRSLRIRTQLSGHKLVLNKQIINKILLQSTGVNRYRGVHIVDQYLDTIKKLDVQDDGEGLDFYLSEKKENHYQNKHIVIVAGGTYVTKRIPYRTIKEITAQQEFQFTLLGGDDVSPEIQKLNGLSINNCIGKLSLHKSALELAYADLIITGDTGLMHIAAALQKPIIVIWGSTSEDIGFYPYYGFNSKQRFISIRNKSLTCQPCSKYGRSRCPKSHMNCLNKISSVEILEAVEELLR